MEEAHADFLRVTENPVEFGANISDHAFLLPQELIIRCAWSNSSIGNIGLALLPANPLGEFFGGASYVQEAYKAILNLQAKRTPLSVFTGKRFYRNMLPIGVEVITDHRSEYALMMRIRLRQTLIVRTQSAKLPDRANQSQPQQTGEQSQTGTKQTAPVSAAPAGVG